MAGTAIWTNYGQSQTINLIDAATRAAVTTTFQVAWGSNAASPAVGQVALSAENPETRETAVVTQPSDDTIQYQATIEATANRSVQEAGVFDAAGNTMWLRGTHALLNIETGDRVEYTFTLRLKDTSEA
jgi:hypothetical protein